MNAALSNLCDLERVHGHAFEAFSHYQETAQGWIELNNIGGAARCLECMAFLAIDHHEVYPAPYTLRVLRGDAAGTPALGASEGMSTGLRRERSPVPAVPAQADERSTQRLETAARLFGKADALRRESGAKMEGEEPQEYERYMTELKSRLDANRLTSAWRAGAGQSLQGLFKSIEKVKIGDAGAYPA
jgi:hypothetical protein